MTFFFDRNVGTRVPRALRIVGLPVEWHDAHFAQNCADDEWMAQVATEGWAIIGHDQRFHQNKAELWAIKQHRLACFYLWGAQMPRWDKLRLFARAYDKIVHALNTTAPPFVYRVDQRGRLRKITLP